MLQQNTDSSASSSSSNMADYMLFSATKKTTIVIDTWNILHMAAHNSEVCFLNHSREFIHSNVTLSTGIGLNCSKNTLVTETTKLLTYSQITLGLLSFIMRPVFGSPFFISISVFLFLVVFLLMISTLVH